MTNDSRERNKWKVRITDCVNQSSEGISQPVAKLMAEVMVGIKQWGFAVIEAKRQKSHPPLVFPFYTLLSGWQASFADAKTFFMTGGENPNTPSPIQADLFINNGRLSPNLS